ncbi:rod shape-determining protein MreC [Thermaerobacter litoralis]
MPWLRRLLAVVLVLALAGGAMAATRHLRPRSTLLEGALQEVLAPLSGVAARMARGAGEIGRTVATLTRLEAENQQLREELERLRGVEAQVRQLERENRQLEELLGLKQARPDAVLAARVTGRTPDRWYQEITLDQGSADGVEPDMVAVVPGGVVGRVVAVTPHSARVLLITDPESGVGALIGRSGEAGVVYGRGGDLPRLVMTLFAADADVRVGDDVVTSGLGPVFPPGLPIGTVTSVGRDPTGLGIQVTVEPSAPLNRLAAVLLLEPARKGLAPVGGGTAAAPGGGPAAVAGSPAAGAGELGPGAGEPGVSRGTGAPSGGPGGTAPSGGQDTRQGVGTVPVGPADGGGGGSGTVSGSGPSEPAGSPPGGGEPAGAAGGDDAASGAWGMSAGAAAAAGATAAGRGTP